MGVYRKSGYHRRVKGSAGAIPFANVDGGVRTQFKNRIHATLSKYAINIDEEVSDVFGQKGRILLEEAIKELPPETRILSKSS